VRSSTKNPSDGQRWAVRIDVSSPSVSDVPGPVHHPCSGRLWRSYPA